jgi:nucleotide-binding universal stress UspA family protein
MKKILVPTDFSPNAEKAFRFAVNLALKNDGGVVLYHVNIPIQGKYIDNEEKLRMYNIQMNKNALKRLQRLKKKIAGASCPFAIETLVGQAPLIDNILGFAEHHEIDLIVMGTQGASGLKKVIIGSEASRIAQESDIPVLLVPEKFEWKEPEQIVFATNINLSEKNAICLSIELANLYNAGITVVHLYEPKINKVLQDKELAIFETFAEYLQKSFAISRFNLSR